MIIQSIFFLTLNPILSIMFYFSSTFLLLLLLLVMLYYYHHYILGNRVAGESVSKHFRPFWSATVHKNFIRLTPERPHHAGALWSHLPLR